MGWLFTQGQSKSDLVKRRVQEWGNSDGDGNFIAGKCLAHTVRGNNLWTVWEITKTPKGENVTPEVRRYIGLDLLSKEKGYGYGYKDLSESMGPCEVNCPIGYLEMVPVPTDSPYAAGWREKVRAFHAKQAGKAKARKDIQVGVYVALVDGVKLNGVPLTKLRVVELPPRKIIAATPEGILVRLTSRHIKEVLA